MRKTDPRYLEEDEALMEGREPRYPHRKPSKATKQKFAVGEVLGSNSITRGLLDSPTARAVAGTAVASATPKVIRALPKAIKAVSKIGIPVGAGIAEGSTVGLASAGTLGLVAAAGLGSYFATKWLIENFPTKQRRLNAAADAYYKSRKDLAASLGRALNQAELKALADHYKEVVRSINAYPF